MTDLYPLPSGLVAITGGERTGKTSLLRRLNDEVPDTQWCDLSLPAADDQQTPEQVWASWQQRCPQWNEAVQQELVAALDMTRHLGKGLFMLSAGSRRKVALVGLLSCGATVTCLDQPYAALDMASIKVLRSFLGDMAEHTSRTWVVADYEADAKLPWKRVVSLD
jgi:ATPase subunit of ABC transporter with duplicated ATPase domains